AIIISTLLFSSFLCWASVIRYANHIGFLIGTLSYEVATTNHNSEATADASSRLRFDSYETELDDNAKAKQKRLKRYSTIDENCKKNIRRLVISFR
ncbi:DUF599 family protein, partial [archaeon]